MQSQSQRLRDRSDQIDRVRSDKYQNRTGAEDEKQRDHRRRDHNRATDVARRGACFAGEDRDIFETAERSDREFAENVEAIKEWDGRSGNLQRAILLEFPTGQTNERKND